MDRASIRALYLRALEDAAARPPAGDPDAALRGFLTLNAGYFLGEWLTVEEHGPLVQRLVASLDGLADLPVPADTVHAAQLAQHVRELEDVFGPRQWTTALIRRTAPLAPSSPEDWNVQVRAEIEVLAGGADGHGLLLVHARRRLWQLQHRPIDAAEQADVAGARLRPLARAALTADGHTIQVLEAVLAEVSANPTLASALLPNLEAAVSAARP